MAVVEYSASEGLFSTTGALRMSFSDTVKYCILGISVLLLLLALSILAWQVFGCFSKTYHHQDTASSELLNSDEKPSTAGNYTAPPNTQVEDLSTKAHRLSHYLSQASFPPDSIQTDGNTREDNAVQKVHGSLRFSLYYDQLRSLLVVRVLQAEGLSDHNTSLQPFVNIRLMWAEGSKEKENEGRAPVLWTVLLEWQTHTVKGSSNPLFGVQYSCLLLKNKNLLQHITLRMQVRDFDKFSRHTVLGEVRVPLGRLNISYPLELQEDLQIPQKDLTGEVLLSLKFLPTSQRLEVGLLKVRTALTETSSQTALYCRISVQVNQKKPRYQRTTAVAGGPVTVFNQVLMFSLPELPLEQCKVLVSVFETPRMWYRRLIGQLSVGKEASSEDEHWTLMVLSVRQPVAKWHRLLI